MPVREQERRTQLHRVAKLCCSFAINLAYYRAGWFSEVKHLLDYSRSNFWRVVNGNFLDICVLEWCKLFADKRGKHHWRHVVRDPFKFKDELLRHLGLTESEWESVVERMKEYRDKFVAHLDLQTTGQYPHFDLPKRAVWFLYTNLVYSESDQSWLGDMPRDIDKGFVDCEAEAILVYKHSASN